MSWLDLVSNWNFSISIRFSFNCSKESLVSFNSIILLSWLKDKLIPKYNLNTKEKLILDVVSSLCQHPETDILMAPLSGRYYLVNKNPDGTETSQPGQMLLDGNIYMDQTTYDGWGNDDDYAINWGLNQVGLTKA
jgi:hypothetical protein